jgi:hypothetical protein
VESEDLVSEFENEVNLSHPCIATPIGFVESGESRELRLAQLVSEGESLAEVLSVKPEWWTPTMKAKAVTGIALSFRYAHSFGFIHGNLDSSKIIFGADHCVQITELRSVSLESDENEIEVGVGGFSGEGWMPMADFDAFQSLLFQIAIGDPGDPNTWAVIADVPEFVPEIIRAIQLQDYDKIGSFDDIVVLLKRNEFRISNEVDSAEVWKFVNWVELWEQSDQ